MSRKQAVSWLIPIGLGILLVSPYLINAVPVYFGSQSSITGAVSAVSTAVVENRLLPLEIPALCAIAILMFFVFAKYHMGKFLTVPALLFASWIIVLILGTQSSLLGFFLDYQRFLYFLSLPIFSCLALIIADSPKALFRAIRFCSRKIKLQRPVKWFKPLKMAITAVLIVALVIVCLPSQLAYSVSDAVQGKNFFEIMDSSQFEAIQWIKNNTPEGSVCVADASFGWWLSGFGERPTFSASNPEFLILQHEYEPAVVATNLLSADYLINNGFLEVQQAGAYASGNTHEIYGILKDSTFHPQVFSLNDSEIGLMLRENGVPEQVSLSAFTNTKTSVVSNIDNASFVVTRENQEFCELLRKSPFLKV